MKPFNAQKALAGAKLVTRDGQAVPEFRNRMIATASYPYEARLIGQRRFTPYGANGEWLCTGGIPHPLDLFLVAELVNVGEETPK